MKYFPLYCGWLCIGNLHSGMIAVSKIEPPDPVQKAIYPFYSFCTPGFHLFEGTHEHFIQTERVRSILFNDIIRINDVPPGFRHFMCLCIHSDICSFDHKMVPPFLYFIFCQGFFSDARERFGFFRRDQLAFPLISRVLHLTKNHTLVDKLFERFFCRYNSTIIKHLVPEARVEQMQYRMLRTTNVEIHRHPVFLLLRIYRGSVKIGADIPQMVPARSCQLRHGVGFSKCFLAGFRVYGFYPLFGLGQWRFTVLGRLKIFYIREGYRKIRHGDPFWLPIHMEDGKWFTPVTLS